MNVPSAIYVVRWLVRDTFRQAVAGRLFWILLIVIGLFILFCFGITIEGGETLQPKGEIELVNPKTDEPLTGPNPNPGKMHVLFGAFRFDLFRDGAAQVQFIQVILATWVAGGVGLLLTLVWTAGFFPEFLQPSTASVLFAKPTPRWLLLAGKYVGVVAFVSFLAVVFFVGTWFALGVRTGFWSNDYLLCIFLFILHFATVFSVSVLLAVCTRNTIACVIGAVLFWVLCFVINFGRHAATAIPEVSPLSAVTSTFVEIGYWILPKPADMIVVLEEILQAGNHQGTLSAESYLQNFDAGWSLATSFLSSVAILALAAWQLRKAEY